MLIGVISDDLEYNTWLLPLLIYHKPPLNISVLNSTIFFIWLINFRFFELPSLLASFHKFVLSIRNTYTCASFSLISSPTILRYSTDVIQYVEVSDTDITIHGSIFTLGYGGWGTRTRTRTILKFEGFHKIERPVNVIARPGQVKNVIQTPHLIKYSYPTWANSIRWLINYSLYVREDSIK